jgi:hypothetical protein
MHSGSDLSYSQRYARGSGVHNAQENLRTRPDDFLLIGQLGVFSVHFFPHLLHAFHPAHQKKSDLESLQSFITWQSARNIAGDLLALQLFEALFSQRPVFILDFRL